MADRIDAQTRSLIMSRIRGRDTGIEMRLKGALRRIGLKGYRLQYGRHRIDIAFVGRKVAVFADGCFWHGCPAHSAMPRTNVGYWSAKLVRNVERDRRTDMALVESGWTVLRFWEHDIVGAADLAAEIVRGRFLDFVGGSKAKREKEQNGNQSAGVG